MVFDIDLLSTHLFIIKKLQRGAFRRCAAQFKGKVLDIGCGTSPYSTLLTGCTCTRIDTAAGGRVDALARAEALPFTDASFDGVICTEVLEHLKSPDKALREMHRVVRASGILYVTVPQSWGLHYEPNDYWRFTKYGLTLLLTGAGFDIVRVERVGGICSMTGARVLDVAWSLLVKMCFFCPGRWAERIATLVCLPGSVFLYACAFLLDRIDGCDALGWAVLAKKQS